MEDRSKKGKNKVVAIVVSAIVSLSLFFAPVIIGGAVIAVPVVAVASFFSSIGDFIFGEDDEANEAIKLMNKLFEDSKQEYVSFYSPYKNAREVEVPYNYLVIPNALIGLELNKDVTDALLQTQLDAAIEEGKLVTTSKYINNLRKIEPYKKAFEGVSTTTIEGYLNYYTSLFQVDTIDKDFIDSLPDKEFLYPLKTKAVVTSEFGGRNIGTVGGVNVNNHTGIDLAYNGGNATTCGVPVYAVMGGQVTKTQDTYSQAGANWGEISQGNGVSQWYLHLNTKFFFNVGDTVKKGEQIGAIGTTGLSTACHLHLEFRVNGVAQNPREFMEFDNPKLSYSLNENWMITFDLRAVEPPKEFTWT